MKMSRSDLPGGVAVVTGAGSGIGAAIASEAAGRGMRVALADVNAEAITERESELRDSGADVFAQACDVSDFGSVDALAERVYDTWGTTTLLVNNAGVELHGNTWELDVAMWNRIVEINLNGVFYGMRAFIPRLLQQDTGAHIANLASVAARRTSTGTSGYAATKHAVLALSDCVRKELAAVNAPITVTAVLPGAVQTAIFESSMVRSGDSFGERHRQALAEHLATEGVKPGVAAAMILDGALSGLRHVHTDPEMSRQFLVQWVAELDESLPAQPQPLTLGSC